MTLSFICVFACVCICASVCVRCDGSKVDLHTVGFQGPCDYSDIGLSLSLSLCHL